MDLRRSRCHPRHATLLWTNEHVDTSQLQLLQTEVVYVMGKGAFLDHWKRTRNPKVAFLACSHVQWGMGILVLGTPFPQILAILLLVTGKGLGQAGLLSLGNRLL